MVPEPAAGVRRNATALAREHPTLVLTLGYLILTAIGMLYNGWLLDEFGVNILNYAQASDFLLAAVRDPIVVGVWLIGVLAAWSAYRFELWIRRRFPRYLAFSARHPWLMVHNVRGQQAFTIFTALLISVFYTAVYADAGAERIRKGKGDRLAVELQSTGDGAASFRALQIGTTSNFVFLYDPERGSTRVVPLENLAQLVVAGQPNRRAPARAKRDR